MTTRLIPRIFVRGANDQIRIDFAHRGANPHLFAKDVEKIVNTILDEIVAALIRRDRVELRGFGTFTVRTWSPRPFGRNPKTGAPISIPETHHPSFRTGKEMKARLNCTPGSALRAAFHRLPE